MNDYITRARLEAEKAIRRAKNGGFEWTYEIECYYDNEEKYWSLCRSGDRGEFYILMETDDESAAIERLSGMIRLELEGIARREEIKRKKFVKFLTRRHKLMEPTEVYDVIRSHMLFAKPADIDMPDLADNIVYAIVIDISQDDGTATIVCTLRGEVEYYHTSGEIFQDLDRDKNIKGIAQEFLDKANARARCAETVNDFPLPPKGITTVYFLTGGKITKMEIKNGKNPKGKKRFTDELISAVLSKIKEINSSNQRFFW